MEIIYRNQLPGKPPRTTRIQGWVAALVGAIVVLGLIAAFLFLLPFFVIIILGFFALIVFSLIGAWLYVALRIGFREMWDITRLIFGIGFGHGSIDERRRRIMKEWEDRTKGKSGTWVK